MIELKDSAPTELGAHVRNIYSQFGEDGVLEEIFRRIGTTNKQCFEVGAADGKWFSNSRKLLDEGWRGFLIEADESNWPQLDKLDGVNGSVVVHGRAEASGEFSLDNILDQCGASPILDLGIIDVDGQDYYLLNGLMRHKPRVLVVEFDPAAAESFVPDLGGSGQAGLAAIISVAVSRGYFNAFVTHTNAIFIHTTEEQKYKQESIAPATILATGQERQIKIAAVLSRPRFGLNAFWDCASEALQPWHIPLQSFGGVFWGQCMQKAMEDNITAGVDWILTLDYDTMFNSKHLDALISALGSNPQIDAIAGMQSRRGRPLPLMVRGDGKCELTGGPVQMTTAHFGLTLFRAEAIAKMKKPWFLPVPLQDGTWGEGRLDEDIYFWHRWRETGNTLFVHTGCRIGHMEEMVSEYDENFKHRHLYLTDWRKANGQRVKAFD